MCKVRCSREWVDAQLFKVCWPLHRENPLELRRFAMLLMYHIHLQERLAQNHNKSKARFLYKPAAAATTRISLVSSRQLFPRGDDAALIAVGVPPLKHSGSVFNNISSQSK